jgi:hypothetical protein
VYDVGHLYTLAYYVGQGLVKSPTFLQMIMGTMGGIGPEVEHLVHLKRTADQLLGDGFEWSVLGAGRNQFNMVTAGAVMGSHVRVGLEDGLFIGKGAGAVQRRPGPEDPPDPRRAVLEAATPDEARQILGLKGLDQVGWCRLDSSSSNGLTAGRRGRPRHRPRPAGKASNGFTSSSTTAPQLASTYPAIASTVATMASTSAGGRSR